MVMASDILDDYNYFKPISEEEYRERLFEEAMDSALCNKEEEIIGKHIISMLNNNFSLDMIKKITGLRKSEIGDILYEHDIEIDEEAWGEKEPDLLKPTTIKVEDYVVAMLKKKFSLNDIVEITKLGEAEIRKVARDNNIVIEE